MFQKEELERVLKEFSECKDLETCMNIMEDLVVALMQGFFFYD